MRSCACHVVPSHAAVAPCLKQATLGGMRPHGPQATALCHAWLLLTLEQSVPAPALITSIEHSLLVAADQGAPAVSPLPRPAQAGHGETQLRLDRSRCLRGTGRGLAAGCLSGQNQLPKVAGLACIRHPAHVQWFTPAWPRGPMPYPLTLPPSMGLHAKPTPNQPSCHRWSAPTISASSARCCTPAPATCAASARTWRWVRKYCGCFCISLPPCFCISRPRCCCTTDSRCFCT